MSESLLGMIVAATRQNAGFDPSSVWPATFMPAQLNKPSIGIRKAPAATSSAAAIPARGNDSLARLPCYAVVEAATVLETGSINALDTSNTIAITTFSGRSAHHFHLSWNVLTSSRWQYTAAFAPQGRLSPH